MLAVAPVAFFHRASDPYRRLQHRLVARSVQNEIGQHSQTPAGYRSLFQVCDVPRAETTRTRFHDPVGPNLPLRRRRPARSSLCVRYRLVPPLPCSPVRSIGRSRGFSDHQLTAACPR
jgi:hypothetical protein